MAARAFHEECLEINREMGAISDMAWSLNNLGDVALAQGELEEAQENYGRLFEALPSLTSLERQCVTLRYMDELSFDGIAERLGTTQGTVTDAQGNTRGTLGGFAASLFPQLSGFSGVVNAAKGQYSFARWSPAALLTASTAPQTGFARVAENPLGGLVAYVQGDKPVAESYDDELRLRWRVSLPLHKKC